MLNCFIGSPNPNFVAEARHLTIVAPPCALLEMALVAIGSRYGKAVHQRFRKGGRSRGRSHLREIDQNEFKNGLYNCGLSP